MQQPRVPKFIIFILILLFLTSWLFFVVAALNPNGRSYPKGIPGPKGDTAQVDYDKLAILIHNEIANLPQPKSGSDGINGSNGKSGKDGKAGTSGLDGTQGVQGEPGTPARALELRHNDALHRTEYRFDGDFTWKILTLDCTLTNTCGP